MKRLGLALLCILAAGCGSASEDNPAEDLVIPEKPVEVSTREAYTMAGDARRIEIEIGEERHTISKLVARYYREADGTGAIGFTTPTADQAFIMNLKVSASSWEQVKGRKVELGESDTLMIDLSNDADVSPFGVTVEITDVTEKEIAGTLSGKLKWRPIGAEKAEERDFTARFFAYRVTTIAEQAPRNSGAE